MGHKNTQNSPENAHRGYFFLPEGHKNTLRETAQALWAGGFMRVMHT